MVAYLVVFLVAAGTTFALTPLVRRLAIRFGAIDEPSDRKLHTVPTPTMGGLAMWAGFLVAIRGLPAAVLRADERDRRRALAAVVTCTMMVGLGVIDDRRGTSALAKLTAQIFIAGILILLGVQLAYFVLPGEGLAVLGTDEAVPLTMLWVLAAANAINLVDGLDGLAAGMVAIAAATFFIYMVRGADVSPSRRPSPRSCPRSRSASAWAPPWNFHPARSSWATRGRCSSGCSWRSPISGSA